MPQVQIDPRFHGPPHSANGGYVCGALAALATTAPVAVSLHAPPPLGRPLQAEVGPGGEMAVEGRKHHGASAILDADGHVLATAVALWITLSAEALATLLAPA